MNFRHLHDIAFFCFIFFLKDSQMVTPPQKKKSMYFIFVCLKNMAIKQKLEKFRQLKLVKNNNNNNNESLINIWGRGMFNTT